MCMCHRSRLYHLSLLSPTCRKFSSEVCWRNSGQSRQRYVGVKGVDQNQILLGSKFYRTANYTDFLIAVILSLNN